ncbi:MAG TPA: hypothetical protein VIM12_11790 [Noviherbaspirillum sp.]|uniref:hypothetical protein n=1 Tax=Noviherbaspirillum sp. TaxID=1926288 RepID=UPI002F95BA8C
MLKKTKIATLLALAAFVTACGGGGGDGDTPNNAAPSTGGSTDTGTGPVTNNPPNNNGNNPPDNNGNNPPGDEQPNQPADQRLNGHLSMVANQLVYLRTNRSIYNAFPLEQFETGQGLFDTASGSNGDVPGAQVPPPAAAPAAPIASFGFRVDRHVQPDTQDQVVGNQKVVGRVAFSLVERAESPDILPTESAESMSFVIDNVELTTNEAGELVSATLREGAQIHVEGRTAQGVPVLESFGAPVGSVRLLDMSEVLDHYGDNSSIVLLFDLERAFSQAGTRLAALENLQGQFAMNVTLSAANIIRPASTGDNLPEKNLAGQPITVTGQLPVTGAGISGTAWIRSNP